MVDKELIEIWRDSVKPSVSLWLLSTNYEEMGEQDNEEFERDFDEILDLALIGLKYKAQLPQKHTEKRTESHACDISRQDAIDALKICDNNEDGINCYKCPIRDERWDGAWQDGEVSCYRKLMRDLAELLSEQPEQRWIPCSERLPEESGYYIVTAHDGTGHRTTFVKYQKKAKSWNLTGARSYWRVIAWMPLPEPYKEGEMI